MNYRDHMKKGECLFNAIFWTIIPVIYLFFSLYDCYAGGSAYLDRNDIWLFILLLVMEAVACAIHWYRYLAYDKKQGDEAP